MIVEVIFATISARLKAPKTLQAFSEVNACYLSAHEHKKSPVGLQVGICQMLALHVQNSSD